MSKPSIRRESAGKPAAGRTRRIRIGGKWLRAPVFKREDLTSKAVDGPALVIDYGSTTLIPSGWSFRLDKAGNLIARSQ